MQVDAIMQRVIRRLGMQYGTGVQLYAEDLIRDMVESTFIRVFELEFWPEYTQTREVDSLADGTVNYSFNYLRPYDLCHVYYDQDVRPLPAFPPDGNLAQFEAKDGRPRWYTQQNMGANDLLRLVPHGDPDVKVYIKYRQRPDFPLATSYDIPFDHEVMVYGACYDYAEDDGTNPGQIEKYKRLYIDKVNSMVSKHNTKLLSLEGTNTGAPAGWQYV